MECMHPLRAWRTRSGEIKLNKRPPDEPVRNPLDIRCGRCLGCRIQKAQDWALRCRLELAEHRHAAFTTLTYDDAHLPPTLQKRDLQLFFKRLRRSSAEPLRFFGCGEYGETTHRPHYHAIIYGRSIADAEEIERTWGQGHARTVDVTIASINYVAGYTAKKSTTRSTPPTNASTRTPGRFTIGNLRSSKCHGDPE